MNTMTEAILTIGTAIVGVAIISTLVSQRAKTAQVIQSAGQAFGYDLGVAMGGVTGFTPSGGVGMGGGMNFSLPQSFSFQ